MVTAVAPQYVKLYVHLAQDLLHQLLLIHISHLTIPSFLSDVIIQVKDKNIKAHRIVLAKASKWFKHQFEQRKEYDSHAIISLAGEGFIAVHAMIRFCYTQECNLSTSFVHAQSTLLRIHAKVFELANRYEVEGLQEFAAKEYRWCGLRFLNNYNLDSRANCLSYFKEDFERQPRSSPMFTAALDIFKRYLKKLALGITHDEFISTIKRQPDIVTEILMDILVGDETFYRDLMRDRGSTTNARANEGCELVIEQETSRFNTS